MSSGDDTPIAVRTRPWARRGDGTVRFALVGLGWWALEHALPAIESTSNCRATVGVSGTEAKRRELKDTGRVVETITYDEFAAGEAAETYDAVYVSTPNARHLPMARVAASHNKHILCEKPLEASYDRASSLVEVCDRAGVRLMAAYRLQTDPALWRLRERVRDGLVGDPLAVHAHISQPLLEFFDSPDQWRLQPSLVGPGSSVMDIGIYPINTTRYVTGLAPVAVTGTTWSGTEPFDSIPDERAAFRLDFGDGVVGQYSVSQNGPLTGSFNLIGEDGRVTLRPAFFGNEETELRVSTADESWTVSYTPVDQMRELFTYFADRVLIGRSFRADGSEALRDIEIIENVYEAAHTGAVVDVPR